MAVWGIFRSCFGSVYSAAFWWVCSAEALHNEDRIKNKSQSLLKVLQSILLSPEQEQFVKTYFPS